MRNWMKILVVNSAYSCIPAISTIASTNLETGSSPAGISAALNSFYADSMELEKQLAPIYSDIKARAGESQGGEGNSKSTSTGDSQDSSETNASVGQVTQAAQAPEETKASEPSAYDNVAASKVNGSVNIRIEANTVGGVTSKTSNDSAVAILDTVDGEGGKWYRIQSGLMTGYIKAEYFVTGQQAEAKTKEVGTTYGAIVGTSSLCLRGTPNLEGKTLTLLSGGAHYAVTGEKEGFLGVSMDSDLEGYVFEEYMKTSVEFNKAVSVEEKRAKAAEGAKRKEDVEKAIKALEEAKEKEAEKRTTEATIKVQKITETLTAAAPKKEKTEGTNPVIQIIAANPESGNNSTVAAPTTQKTTENTQSRGPGSPGTPSSEVVSATRNAVMAYAKQFLGNPYMYGGTSLTSDADCSGFTQSIFSHFGISTGRSSRDQAAKGKMISVNEAKPGDLLFYASGDYINHMALYIGGGQIVHASNPTTGICISSVNYRTPCKAVTFLD